MRVKTNRMLLIAYSFMALCLIESILAMSHASGSDYPNKTVSVIVGVPPGGNTDMGTRLLAEVMQKDLNQSIVVVNRPGGAGTIGGYAVASAKPDGYTIGMFPPSYAFPEIYTYFYSAPYSSNDLRPICRVFTAILVVSVRAEAPWNSLKELVEYARKNPGMKFGHLGRSTTQYVSMVTIARAEKLQMVDVPFNGDGDLVPALLGGHVPVGVISLTAMQPLLAAKKVKLLGILTENRVSSVADIPTLPELGYRLPYVPFLAIYGPKKMPDEPARRIEEVVRKIAATKDFQDKAVNVGLEVTYENAPTLEKQIVLFKGNAYKFFKDEGMVK